MEPTLPPKGDKFCRFGQFSVQTLFRTDGSPRRWIYATHPWLPPHGSEEHLPFLQNYQMVDVASFRTTAVTLPLTYTSPLIEGLVVASEDEVVPLVQWPLSVTINMVDTSFQYSDKPIPVQIHYNWTPDGLYGEATDRVRLFNASNIYNPCSVGGGSPCDAPTPYDDTEWMWGLPPA